MVTTTATLRQLMQLGKEERMREKRQRETEKGKEERGNTHTGPEGVKKKFREGERRDTRETRGEGRETGKRG